VIEKINEYTEHTVFILWGSHAQKKCKCVDPEKHLILKSVHPSPLSAYRGFFGCNHFIQCNEYLVQHGKKPICWQPPLDLSNCNYTPKLNNTLSEENSLYQTGKLSLVYQYNTHTRAEMHSPVL
jgi:hypothetical protein